MKKKVLTVALVAALIAIMVSGTLAYFTADDEVTNTFTIGSVRIEIYENDKATDKTTLPFGSLTPIVNTADPSKDESYIQKEVNAQNTGLNAAYIRVHIAQPYNLLGYLELETDTTTGWERVYTTEMTMNGQRYIVVTYDYLTAVEPGEFTADLLKGAYLADFVDLATGADVNAALGVEQYNADDLYFVTREDGEITECSGFVAHKANGDGTYTSENLNVLVYAQAIQAQGFSGASTALDSGFDTNTNPWQ